MPDQLPARPGGEGGGEKKLSLPGTSGWRFQAPRWQLEKLFQVNEPEPIQTLSGLDHLEIAVLHPGIHGPRLYTCQLRYLFFYE